MKAILQLTDTVEGADLSGQEITLRPISAGWGGVVKLTIPDDKQVGDEVTIIATARIVSVLPS